MKKRTDAIYFQYMCIIEFNLNLQVHQTEIEFPIFEFNVSKHLILADQNIQNLFKLNVSPCESLQ